MIYVIGDSHARSFAKNTNFLPLFIGPGKENCFISDGTKENVRKNISRVLEKIPVGADVLLILGEPDTRYYLGKGWTPWLVEQEEVVSDVESKIASSFRRYQEVITWVKTNFNHNLMVFNVPPTIRKNQNIYVKAFNRLLRKEITKNGDLFVDIEDRILSEDMEVIREFVGDEVHLNDSIQLYVEDFLIQHGVLQDRKFRHSNTDYDAKAVQNSFVFNEQFSCYVFQDKRKPGFFRQLMKIKDVICGCKVKG